MVLRYVIFLVVSDGVNNLLSRPLLGLVAHGGSGHWLQSFVVGLQDARLVPTQYVAMEASSRLRFRAILSLVVLLH